MAEPTEQDYHQAAKLLVSVRHEGLTGPQQVQGLAEALFQAREAGRQEGLEEAAQRLERGAQEWREGYQAGEDEKLAGCNYHREQLCLTYAGILRAQKEQKKP